MSLGQWDEAGGKSSTCGRWAPCRPQYRVISFQVHCWDVFFSVSVVFHLRLLKENISLSYIFSPRKHPLGTEFPIDSSEDAYDCYSEFINCNIAI